MELLKWLLTGLVPPHDAEGPTVYRWRLAVAVMTMSNAFGVVGLTVLCFGTAPIFFHGFAKVDDVASVKAQFSTIQTNQIDAKILDTRTRQCLAIASKNGSALQFATARLQDELSEYETLSGGRRYRLPACEEL